MRELPLDHRGYPVPYIVEFDRAGKPIFVINSAEKVRKCIRQKLCSICGQRLIKELWFVGGPRSAFHPVGAYIDPPVHWECMHYALRVCPYLALPSRQEYMDEKVIGKLEQRMPNEILVDPTMLAERPDPFVAVMSYGRNLVRGQAGNPNPYQRPLRPYHAIEFWRHGRELSFKEGLEMIAGIPGLDLSALRLIEKEKLHQ